MVPEKTALLPVGDRSSLRRELETENAHEDKPNAHKARPCDWVSEKGNAAGDRSHRTNARPDGIRRANGERLGCHTQQTNAQGQGNDGTHARP